MCERRIGFFSLNFLHFSETFSISLIGMSELLSRSAVPADCFFHNAFRHASESPESGSLLVHRSEELLPFAIDEADFAEVTITSLFPESSPRASSVRLHVPRVRRVFLPVWGPQCLDLFRS